jgi:hypothetical protein
MDKHKFKLKGTGPITYPLGCDFFLDSDGNMCMAPNKYIGKMVSTYEQMFGCKPCTRGVSLPLEKGDHPEIDTSDFSTKRASSSTSRAINHVYWTHRYYVMTLSGFRTTPRIGHLDRAKCVYGYLYKMKYAMIRDQTERARPTILIFRNRISTEVEFTNAPEPLGKYVTLTHYVDANLFHDIITGRFVTGILHLVNKTQIAWYYKKQATVETATYGLEYVAAPCTCVEQVMDLRLTLRRLRVPIRSRS